MVCPLAARNESRGNGVAANVRRILEIGNTADGSGKTQSVVAGLISG
jgi:hypothetical protein